MRHLTTATFGISNVHWAIDTYLFHSQKRGDSKYGKPKGNFNEICLVWKPFVVFFSSHLNFHFVFLLCCPCGLSWGWKEILCHLVQWVFDGRMEATVDWLHYSVEVFESSIQKVKVMMTKSLKTCYHWLGNETSLEKQYYFTSRTEHLKKLQWLHYSVFD